ncbi:gastrokine-2 [Tympanuchus pallidicinctus]|uniref:gastrokine-2 n=1 Tax=Tympanuchus pallidicinctus TaxID=109042 RepID=UPI002287413B|nr:gastrokine-2 [Tympanuchus pallidicinctus]
MKAFAAIFILLGVFWTQTSALESYLLPGPNNEYVTGSMTIDNKKNYADVHVRSGMYSSDTIFDYQHGYIATRLFARHACFIMKIDGASIPELQEIGRQAFERQTMRKIYSPRVMWVQFQPGDAMFGSIREWLRYGKPIEQLCKGLPLYKLTRSEPLTNSNGCASAGIPSILGFNICEKLRENY